MKKIKVLFLILVFTTAYSASAQSHEQGMVGFSCSFAGTPSLLVMKMSKLASKSKYEELRRKLVEGNTGEKYLAIILCETLEEKNEITLTTVEKAIIEDSYHSYARVSICAGCTMFQAVSLSELLNQTSSNHFGGRARKWAKGVL